MRVNNDWPTGLQPFWQAGTGEANMPARRVDEHRGEDKKLLNACREFEALFWHQVLRQMRRSISKSGLLDGGTGEEIFQDYLDEEYARRMAGFGSGSLARILYDQLIQGNK